MQRRTEYPNEGLRINVVFQIPGRLRQRDFEGVFPARYARKTNNLLRQCCGARVNHVRAGRDFFVLALKETKSAASDRWRMQLIQRSTIALSTSTTHSDGQKGDINAAIA